MKNADTHGEGRGRAVDAERSKGSKVDPAVRVEVGEWSVEVGRPPERAPGEGEPWGVLVVGPWGDVRGRRWVRVFGERSAALAFAVAFVPWLDRARRWPADADLDALEDLACPIVRTDATPGALVRGLVLGGTDPMVDRLAMAYAFGRALDAAPGGQCTDDEEDRQRLALSLAGWWMASRDVECVREGLAMLARGERLDGFRWGSWLVSVARIAGVRGAEVSK